MEKTLRRLDAASLVLLLLWLGMTLGFAALMAPALFSNLPSKDLAGRLAGVMVARLDLAAWIAFGGALLLSYGGRWLNEIQDASPIGPLRLWSAAALVALLFTFSSTFLATPRLHELRAQMSAPVESLPQDDARVASYRKTHGLSTQFFFIRMVLAAALVWGLGALPKEKQPEA
ncbi:MAG: DUF4149 domain-containing protein [Acidobacteriota bacterium]|nr:DUF4149 domain-containing protein [Acidobacteriota bacterium]